MVFERALLLSRRRAPPLDSACVLLRPRQRIYSGGKCEPVVGLCLKTLAADDSQGAGMGASRVRVTTKAHPSQPGGLSRAGLESQLAASMAALGVDQVSTAQVSKAWALTLGVLTTVWRLVVGAVGGAVR